MIQKTSLALIIAQLLIHFATFGQISVFHANTPAGQPTRNGAFYVLPQTTLKVDVVIKTEEKIKGPFSEYAKRFFGFENVNSFSYTTYSIEKVVISALSEPDPNQVYYVEFGERDARDPRTFTLQINDRGFPVSANNMDQRGAADQRKPREIVLIENMDGSIQSQGFYPFTLIEPIIDTIVRRVAVGTEITEQSFYRMRLSNLPTEELALNALSQIEELRDMKLKLVTGFQETPYSPETIRFMFDELNKQENELFDLFRGKTLTFFDHYTFYHTPDKSKDKGIVNLFKFSPSDGITTNRGSGKFVQLEIEPSGYEQVVASFPETGARNGFAYRVPGFAAIKVKLEDTIFLEEKITVNQYGVVKRLPAQRFNASFHPETGGLKSVAFD
jgi:hypothetical protein